MTAYSSLKFVDWFFFQQESVNVAADKQKWATELKRELEFAREEHDKTFDNEMKAFEHNIEIWKDMHSKVLA